MTASLGKLRTMFFGGLPEEINSLRKLQTKAAPRLGKIFLTVIQSYQATLQDSRLSAIVHRVNAVEADLRGFAYEGAAMGLMQLDCMLPWKKRLSAFLAGPASPYIYPAYVGAGLALARLGKQPEQFLTQLDPVLGWMLIDGYGWRYGIFSRRSSIDKGQEIPAHLSGHAGHVFSQGLGRSLWFSTGAAVDRIATIIDTFPSDRRADLWSGVGFACAYAGGEDREGIETMQRLAGPYKPHLAVGASIGAKGRERGGNLAPHTDLACEVLCGLSADQAAHITDIALQDLPVNGVEPAFATWRQRIEAHFAAPVTVEI